MFVIVLFCNAPIGKCLQADDARNAAAVPDELGEAEYFRRLNNSRKTKAEAFLKNDKSKFKMLSTLTLASVLAPITRICFLTSNSDNDRVHQSSAKAVEKVKRRLFFKTADPPVAEPKQHSFSELPQAISKCVDRLWAALLSPTYGVFHVASVFWPRESPTLEMFRVLTDEILGQIAALKWRLKVKFRLAPLSSCSLDRHLVKGVLPMDNASAEMMADIEQHRSALCNTRECCLDPHWGAPIQKQLLEEETAADASKQHRLFAQHMSSALCNFRINSLREECMRAIQRQLAGGDRGAAARQRQQSAGFILRSLSAYYGRRGNRNLKTASKHVQQAAKIARAKKVQAKRPKQHGSPMFAFIALERR